MTTENNDHIDLTIDDGHDILNKIDIFYIQNERIYKIKKLYAKMKANNDILNLCSKLPLELVHIILAYSYKCQPAPLCADIRSFFETKKRICDTFYLRYKDILVHEERADMSWLTSDVMCYMNRNHASFHQYEEKFYEITTRHFQLKNKSRSTIHRIFSNLYKKPIFSQFHILWGLLLPEEREHFIQIQSRILY